MSLFIEVNNLYIYVCTCINCLKFKGMEARGGGGGGGGGTHLKFW